MPLPQVVAVAEHSPAERFGVWPGDELRSMNGRVPRDVIEYQLLADESIVELEVVRGGVELEVTVVKQTGEPLGLEVSAAIFDRVRTCDNHCEFCFIYQLPKGMRKNLYVKDDDYRLSFLYGNFTTLTRFTEVDLERVLDQGLSPLYVSIHANTSPFNKTASGFEVWCLPPSYERTLVDEKATGKENLDILPILNSMREEEISLESTVLAQNILAGLDGSIGQKSADRGLRQNDWYVVRNARMPAVLTEVGFVSNAEEAPRLADPAYLNDVAKGMYDGVKAFIQGFERSGSGGAR